MHIYSYFMIVNICTTRATYKLSYRFKKKKLARGEWNHLRMLHKMLNIGSSLHISANIWVVICKAHLTSPPLLLSESSIIGVAGGRGSIADKIISIPSWSPSQSCRGDHANAQLVAQSRCNGQNLSSCTSRTMHQGNQQLVTHEASSDSAGIPNDWNFEWAPSAASGQEPSEWSRYQCLAAWHTSVAQKMPCEVQVIDSRDSYLW
jgi:hypothetical protein